MMTLFDEDQVMRAYVESEKEEAAVISAIEMCQEIGLPVSETIKKVAGFSTGLPHYKSSRYRL